MPQGIATYSDTPVLKEGVHKASVSDGKAWFKTVARGELLGDYIFSSVFTRMEKTDFFRKIKALEAWVLAK